MKRLSCVGGGIEEKQMREGLSSENKSPFIKIGYSCALRRRKTAVPTVPFKLFKLPLPLTFKLSERACYN